MESGAGITRTGEPNVHDIAALNDYQLRVPTTVTAKLFMEAR